MRRSEVTVIFICLTLAVISYWMFQGSWSHDPAVVIDTSLCFCCHDDQQDKTEV